MERASLSVESRDATGKSEARKMRRDGFVPGVIYREGKSQPITLNKRDVAHFINSTAGEKAIVDLKFSNGDIKAALLKDYQVDPVRGELLHTDFFEVSMKEAIVVTVPIVTVGIAVGVKRDGGIIQNIVREIEVECLPDKIPGHLEIDITNFEIGHTVHVKDLPVPEGVEIISNQDDTVLILSEPSKVEEVVPVEEEEAAVPEVEKKGKKEEAGEEETKEADKKE